MMTYSKDQREWNKILWERQRPKLFLGYKRIPYYENENDYGKIPSYKYLELSDQEKEIYILKIDNWKEFKEEKYISMVKQ